MASNASVAPQQPLTEDSPTQQTNYESTPSNLITPKDSSESSPNRPTLEGRMPSVPNFPQLTDVGRPLLRRIGSTAGGLFKPPTIDNLAGRWHITHSTLPIWRDKRNVTITYTVTSSDKGTRLDDLVEYQERGSRKVKSVKGVDTTPRDSNDTSKWNWRGKGIIKVASAQWEILGWGIDDGRTIEAVDDKVLGNQDQHHLDSADERHWMVTYFAKTPFTPAGMDVYSRYPDGLSDRLFKDIKAALLELENSQLRELATRLFDVQRDGTREF